jgi:hypothetical protein
VHGVAGGLKAFAVYPGSERRIPVALTASGDVVRMVLGTRRGCALVKIEGGLH